MKPNTATHIERLVVDVELMSLVDISNDTEMETEELEITDKTEIRMKSMSPKRKLRCSRTKGW